MQHSTNYTHNVALFVCTHTHMHPHFCQCFHFSTVKLIYFNDYLLSTWELRLWQTPKRHIIMVAKFCVQTYVVPV